MSSITIRLPESLRAAITKNAQMRGHAFSEEVRLLLTDALDASRIPVSIDRAIDRAVAQKLVPSIRAELHSELARDLTALIPQIIAAATGQKAVSAALIQKWLGVIEHVR